MPSAQPSAPPSEKHAPRAGAAPERYYPAFDLLRIALALAVVLHHENVFGWRPAGNLAVQVFFALSGWLIGGILQGTTRAGLARFWFNRATRIWIPYYSAVGILLTLAVVRDPVGATWLRTAFHYATFTYNWFGYPEVEAGSAVQSAMPLRGTGHPFWSIGAEEQFYLVAPLLLVIAPTRLGRSPLTWGTLSAAAVLGNVYGSISLGVLASVLRVRHGDWHRTPAATAAVAAVGLGAAVALMAGAPYHLAAPSSYCSRAMGRGRRRAPSSAASRTRSTSTTGSACSPQISSSGVSASPGPRSPPSPARPPSP
jgi:peptidoglycan/LPS O-acetylase OafA/YrhL